MKIWFNGKLRDVETLDEAERKLIDRIRAKIRERGQCMGKFRDMAPMDEREQDFIAQVNAKARSRCESNSSEKGRCGMIEIRSNKGGVVHTVRDWGEVPALAEHIETLRPKYFTEASFPMVARAKGLGFDVVIIEAEEKPEEVANDSAGIDP